MDSTGGLGTHRTVHVDGQRIHLLESGEGPLILLLHDASGAWFSWRHQIPVLADAGYRIAAVDMRGFGRSAQPSRVDDYRITAAVADCVGVVRALGESRAVVVGHDLGAIVAWTAAWTRPDIFRAVGAICVPFGGRALLPIAGASTLGEVRPSEAYRLVANDPDLLFYIEYRCIPGAAEADFEADVAGYVRSHQYSNSADAVPQGFSPPHPLRATPEEVLAYTRTSGTCIPRGASMRGRHRPLPDPLPDWLAGDVELFVAEYERTGLTGSLSYYRAFELGWELLAPYEGRPVRVPALFIGSDIDISTLWGSEAIARFEETVPELTETVMLSRCGHWVPREKPDETNEALLRFLRAVDR
jgi:pimeloyl-ACP methyl ester carboxylesterase